MGTFPLCLCLSAFCPRASVLGCYYVGSERSQGALALSAASAVREGGALEGARRALKRRRSGSAGLGTPEEAEDGGLDSDGGGGGGGEFADEPEMRAVLVMVMVSHVHVLRVARVRCMQSVREGFLCRRCSLHCQHRPGRSGAAIRTPIKCYRA